MEEINKYLKPKKGFVQEQLNIKRLTPIQWDGIMRAMDKYAEHYHECALATQNHETPMNNDRVLTAGDFEQTGQNYFASEMAEYNRVLQNAINFKNKIDGCNA